MAVNCTQSAPNTRPKNALTRGPATTPAQIGHPNFAMVMASPYAPSPK